MTDYSKPILSRSVRRAREILQKEAMDIVNQHLDAIKLAIIDKDYQSALEAQRWLIEHIADDEGLRLVEISVDKKVEEKEQKIGPQVNIGIQLGGVPIKQVEAPISPTPILEAKVEPNNSLPAPSQSTLPEKTD